MHSRIQRQLAALALAPAALSAEAAVSVSDDKIAQIIVGAFCLIALGLVAVLLGITASVARPGTRMRMVKQNLPWLFCAELIAAGLLVSLYANGAQESLLVVALRAIAILVVLTATLSVYAFFSSRRTA